MVEIKDLKISADNKFLDIHVSVFDNIAYEDVEISRIAFVSQNNYTIGYPDSTKYELEITQTYPIEEYRITDPKEYKARIPYTMLNIEKNMYFVYILTTGVPAIEVGCGCDVNPTIGVAVNLLPLHLLKQVYLKDFICNCSENRDNLVDLIIKEDAFKNAIIIKDYPSAIALYNSVIKPDFDKCLRLHKGCGVDLINSCNC